MYIYIFIYEMGTKKYLNKKQRRSKKIKGGTFESLHHEASRGNVENVKKLINAGADKDAKDIKDQTPLHHAARNGKTEVVELLINLGANKEAKDVKGHTPLHYAVSYGNIDTVRFLIDSKADMEAKNDFEETSLHLAIDSGSIDIVRFLIDSKANVEAKTDEGNMLLHLAVTYRRRDITKFLINSGADLEARNNDGNTHLHLAADVGDADITKILIKLGADLEARNNDGNTPLHMAARTGEDEGVEEIADTTKILINSGADLEARNNNGNTPLHLAARSGDEEVVELLIQMEADIDAKDNDGNTPLALAKNREIRKKLIDQGANLLSVSDIKYPSTSIDTLEQVILQDSEIPKTVYDTITMEEMNVKEFLKKNKANKCFKYDNQYFLIDGLKIARNFLKNKKMISHNTYYKCKEVDTMKPSNIVKDPPLFLISKIIPLDFFLSMNDILGALKSDHQYFEIQKEGEAIVSSVTADVLLPGASYISANHCQAGKDSSIHKIAVIELHEQTKKQKIIAKQILLIKKKTLKKRKASK
jgi:ankyrin repeat protein